MANAHKGTVKDLKKILFKWKLFGRRKYKIKRKLAAMALADLGSEEALNILQQGTKKRNKDIKLVCETALKQK